MRPTETSAFPASTLPAIAAVSVLALLGLPVESRANQVHVANATALMNATRSAVAGDTILVAPGTYTGNTSQSGDPGNLPNGTGYFWIGNDGTAQHPIVVVAEDPARPPVLQGASITTGYVVHVTGKHVVLKNLVLTTADKAVVFDHASHGLLEDCEYNAAQLVRRIWRGFETKQAKRSADPAV